VESGCEGLCYGNSGKALRICAVLPLLQRQFYPGFILLDVQHGVGDCGWIRCVNADGKGRAVKVAVNGGTGGIDDRDSAKQRFDKDQPEAFPPRWHDKTCGLRHPGAKGFAIHRAGKGQAFCALRYFGAARDVIGTAATDDGQGDSLPLC